MRGPGLRVLCDVRRTWECPQCGYRRRAPQTETVVHCKCDKSQPQMKLIEPQRRVRGEPEPLDVFIEMHPDDVGKPCTVPPPEFLTNRDAIKGMPPAKGKGSSAAAESRSRDNTQRNQSEEGSQPEEARRNNRPSGNSDFGNEESTATEAASPKPTVGDGDNDEDASDTGDTVDTSDANASDVAPKKRKRRRRRKGRGPGNSPNSSPPNSP